MDRSTARARAGVATLALLLAVSAAPSAAPAGRAEDPAINPTLTGAPAVPEILPGPPHGIRSYGRGAVRTEPSPARAGGPIASDSSAFVGGGATLGALSKISGSPMAGSVTAFRVSPSGAIVVFIADKDTVGRFELYSVPASGSAAPVKISSGLPFGSGDVGVRGFQFTPDSTRVVFLADANAGGGVDDLYSVPADGSAAPVQLSLASQRPITGFGITANSVHALYFGKDSTFGTSRVELHRATIGTAASAVQLSDVGPGNSQGDVVAADFSPDSTSAIYAADGTTNNVFQWYSVPINAAGPGSDVQISAALGTVSLGRVSPDSSRIVYTGDDITLGKREVFSAPIAGGAKIKLNPSMAGNGASAIEISPNSSRVGYLADQHAAGVPEVYSAQMLVAGSGVRVNTPLSAPQSAASPKVSPDSTSLIYEADQNAAGTMELFRVPISGGAAPTTLHGLTAPADVGIFAGLGTPIIGKRVVYPVFGATVDVFSVPFDGSAPFVQVNSTLAPGDRLFSVFLPAVAKRLMAYGVGPSSGTATKRIHVAAIRSDLPPEQINTTAAANSRGVLGYEITSDERYGIYLQDQDTLNKPELYSRELDSDGDAVVNALDNCPFIANTSQGTVVFPAEVGPAGTTGFTWGVRLDVRFVRGPLSGVGGYATNLSGTLIEASSLNDPESPAAGSGFYYLFAPDCRGRSYQTSVGAQPGRDLAAFP